MILKKHLLSNHKIKFTLKRMFSIKIDAKEIFGRKALFEADSKLFITFVNACLGAQGQKIDVGLSHKGIYDSLISPL
jgi:hypothetical protein